MLEDRLHPIGLGPDTVDRGDLGAVRQRIDVVADVGIGRWEDDAPFTLDGQKLLLQVQRDRTFQIVGPTNR